jgi:hypothetical protein
MGQKIAIDIDIDIDCLAIDIVSVSAHALSFDLRIYFQISWNSLN